MSFRVLLAGGGTGGHVIPALAVAEQLRAEDPEAELLFVGAHGGLEAKLVPPAGFELALLAVGKLKGSGFTARLRTLVGLPPAVVRAIALARRFDPDVVVGVGGYASGPLALAARLLRRPLLLLEQNAIPGSTNRALARLAQRVVTSFEGTPGFPPDKTICLGNPLRARMVSALTSASAGPARAAGAEERGGGARPARLFVFGGSQGARWLNESCVEALPQVATRLPAGLEVVHQTGEADRERVRAAYAEAGLAATVAAFFSDEMVEHYRWADLALCRSGATTIAELGVAGLPAFLVPYPYAANDHQAANAQQAVEAGGALMRRQGDLDAGQLARTLTALLDDRARLAHMAGAMRSCGRPRAAAAVVALLRELAISTRR
ncbi:MAG: undecaprenyldiphospho-muramoylpentapeptide beta-N-acetylglucosaminyltransferase [Proteobacteria bacterium]|nr:MAG: undecaprenyldiphospho-muramoylpentapeptide beta-N-acetylglucosaminyltransferase [Pseudomonadota bacterium]PIE18071.1 MAG: undecaprenyldiphospho-muramoylpentapeptide beta-N-acetylglucosaminyltransferase [Pseudomonadota bacterium]